VVESGGDITVAEGTGDEVEETGRPPSSRRKAPLSSRVGPAVSRRKSAAFEVRKGNPIMALVLMLTAAAAIFALCVFGSYLVEDYRTGVGTAGEAKYVPGFLEDMFNKTKTWGEPK
jgi:hypothetical protein